MKKFFALASIFAALICSAKAEDTTVKLTDVHLCCNSCVKGVDKALTSVSGSKAVCDKEASTVVITASDKATAQKAVDALVAAGYYGKSSDDSIKVASDTGATDAKVKEMKVSGVHLCCAKCVKAVHAAVMKAPGVTGETAAKDAETFEVTGDFSPKDVFAELNKAGLTGTVGK